MKIIFSVKFSLILHFLISLAIIIYLFFFILSEKLIPINTLIPNIFFYSFIWGKSFVDKTKIEVI